ncbi:hypothetical protein GE09DRAFT_1055923 [Coniochaeta sp. 2T2.1]|nr:hypothetical protein GE09DRAFT_1055923 [Coniochaeta sp. 2T2.1]
MLNKLSVALAAALAISAEAAWVHLYHDKNCQNFAGERNVWDNTCAPTGSFSSFKVVSDGGGDQNLRAYSRNACVFPTTSICAAAKKNDQACISAYNSDGASNAIGSWSSC